MVQEPVALQSHPPRVRLIPAVGEAALTAVATLQIAHPASDVRPMTASAQPRNSKVRAARGPINVTPVIVWTVSAVISSAVARVWPVMERRPVQQQEPVRQCSMGRAPASAQRSPPQVVVWMAPAMARALVLITILGRNVERRRVQEAIFIIPEAAMALVLA